MEATEATYDVLIVGFDQRDEPPAVRLERAFGIAPEAAAQIVGKLPAAVQRGVLRVRADYFTRALVLIGASVEVRDKQGELIAAHAPEPSTDPAEPSVHVVRPPEPAARLQVSATPPPFTFDPSPAPNPWIDPMSRTIAAGPPVMNAHESPRAAQQTPHQAFAAVATGAAEPAPAHDTVRELNAVTPELVAAAARAAGSALAAPTFITAPRSGAHAAPAAAPVFASAGPTLATGAPRMDAAHAQTAAPLPGNTAHTAPVLRASSAPAAPVFAAPASLVEQPVPPAAAATPRWDSAPRQPAPVAAPAAPAWNDPAPLAQPHAGAAWARVPPSVWDPPGSDGTQVSPPREPSSVFDPPPNKAAPRPEGHAAPAPLHAPQPAQNMLAPTLDPNARPTAASALEPTPVVANAQHPINASIHIGAKPHPLDVPPKFGGGVPVLDLGPKPGIAPEAAASLASFDIGKSVAVNALWRPPAPLPGPTPALTFEHDPAAAVARVLAPWEQPNAQAVVAPPPLELPPSPRLPPRVGALAAPERGAAPAAKPARAQNPAAGTAQPAPRRAPPARPRGPKPAVNADAGALPPADGAPVQRPAAPRPAAAVGKAERFTSRSLAGVDLRSFWETVPEALTLPFSGPGLYWILAISVWSIAVGVMMSFMRYALFVSPFMIMLSNSTLAFACDYYRVCTWAPISGEKVIDRKPDFDPVRLFHGYMRSGMHLFVFMIVTQIPGIWYFFHGLDGDDGVFGVLIDPITWLLFLLPYFYWPMGVGLTAIGNNFAAIWNVPQGVRVIARLPLEYGVIVFIGVLAFGFSLLCLLLFGQLMGVTGVLVSSTFGLPLAVSHGVQGALMGHLVRSNAEAFE